MASISGQWLPENCNPACAGVYRAEIEWVEGYGWRIVRYWHPDDKTKIRQSRRDAFCDEVLDTPKPIQYSARGLAVLLREIMGIGKEVEIREKIEHIWHDIPNKNSKP